MLVLEGLEGHHRSIQLELLWHQWLGIDLDYSVKWSWKQTKTILLFLRFHLSLHAVGPLSPLPPEDVLDPGIEPVSPALAGGFFTAEPPGKPSSSYQSFLIPFAFNFAVTMLLKIM